MKPLHTTLALALISSIAVTGCANGTSAEPSASDIPSATATTTPPPNPTTSGASPSPEASTTPEMTQSAMIEPTDQATPDAPLTTPSGPAPVRSGEVVHLSSIFDAEGEWEENRFGFANKAAVPGIATMVTSCDKDSTSNPLIELRLKDSFTSVSFDVAQGDSSKSSDQRLTTEIIANGSQIDIDTVAFNKIKHYTANITNVNALKIRFFLDDTVESCPSSKPVQAVISNLIVK